MLGLVASPDEWFKQTLEAFKKGTLPAYKVFDLGLSPDLGIKKLPKAQILMHQATLRKSVEKHALDIEYLRNLPLLVREPLQIFDSNSDTKSVVSVLDMLHGSSKRVVVVTEYTKHADFGMVHMVKSVHPRLMEHFERWEKLGLLIYTKKAAKQPLKDSARYSCEQQSGESLADLKR